MRKTSQNVLRIPAAKVSSIITLLLIVRVSYNKVDLVEAAKVEKKEEIEKQVLQNGNLNGICLIGVGPPCYGIFFYSLLSYFFPSAL